MEFKELNKKEMGARIRARREAMNMSRSELGALLSVTGKFIADIEYGDKGVSLKNLYKKNAPPKKDVLVTCYAVFVCNIWSRKAAARSA